MRGFLSSEKMAAINQDRFTLTTDDTVEELCNDAKKISKPGKPRHLCVEDLKQRKEHNFGNLGTRTDRSEEIT